MIARLLILALATTSAALPGVAAAQEVPGGALQPAPDRRETPLPDFAIPPDPVPGPVPGPAPGPGPGPAPTLASPDPLAATTSQATVVLTDVAVEGDSAPAANLAWPDLRDEASGLMTTLAPGEAIGPAWLRRQFAANGLIGKPAELGRVIGLIQLINQRFVALGYVNSGVLVSPQPAIEREGVLRLDLVLGRIAGEGTILIEAPAKGLASRYISRRLPSAGAIPFNAAAFEREFRLLAEDEALATINADLAPTARAGEAALRVAAIPADRFDLYTAFANNRSPSIGGERLALGGSVRNVLGAGDLLFAEIGTTAGVEDATLSYRGPLTRSLGVFINGFVNDAIVIDEQLRPLDIRTRSHAFDAGIERALIREPLLPRGNGTFSPAQSLTARLSVTHRDTTTFLLGERFSFSPGAQDGIARYTAARAGLDYLQRSVRQVLAGSFTVTLGLDGTRSDVPGVPTPDENFVGVLGQFNFARRLDDSGLELRARAEGRWHSSVVYPGERAPVGGIASVRGFRETLYLADNALRGSLELARSFDLAPGARSDRAGPGAITVAAFVDAVAFGNRADPQPPRGFLASAGASLAWSPIPALSARVIYAYGFQDVVVGGARDMQDDGFHFAMTFFPLKL
ncbi:MAG: ShlB/FhaC/HecB family hemolysin secretion/activation protein [Erythrobacter sp.]|jgi:hemolysin activation/secretion protein|nr:ShlB/FhaC/HecB family hemolysin secretion/activation protein [Erythrobacter sp.]